MSDLRTAPASARILNQWVDTYARRQGQPPARIRNWVSYMILGGALQRAGLSDHGPRFTIKGGVAIELRLRDVARATKDLDLIATSQDPVTDLEDALGTPYEGFSFRLKTSPHEMPNGAIRLEVALAYRGKPWDTVTIDLGGPERGTRDVEMVDAIPLAHFGLNGPDSLPCLSLPYHVAQKVHALTRPASDTWRNDRVKDLVDLLLLREWVADHAAVRQSCVEVFEERGTHPWPPYFDPPKHWEAPFGAMAAECGIEIRDLYDAAAATRSFLDEIDADRLVAPKRLGDSLEDQ